MSLSKWERRALGAIEDGLARSDPALASRLGIFSRLAFGEEMPMRGKIEALRLRAARRRSRPGRHPGQDTGVARARRLYQRLGQQRAAYLLWLVISAGLIAMVLALNTGGGHASCAQLLRVACGG
jgi:hypothetical protein